MLLYHATIPCTKFQACAEGFTSISNTVEQPVRVQVLTPLFLHLLNDTSRYVKLAAYQQLGPFITTFQNSNADCAQGNKPASGKEYVFFCYVSPLILNFYQLLLLIRVLMQKCGDKIDSLGSLLNISRKMVR